MPREGVLHPPAPGPPGQPPVVLFRIGSPVETERENFSLTDRSRGDIASTVN